MALLVATGVALTGERRVLGLELSAGHDEGSAWPRFVRSLVARGLDGVRLVISDDHAGLVRAIDEQFLGPRGSAAGCTSPATPRTSCRDRPGAWSPRRSAWSSSSPRDERPRAARPGDRQPPAPLPAVAELLTRAEPALLAHFEFPESHRRQIRSTNPLERLNKEIKRRTAVVGIFPTRASALRLVGMILAEQDDEWQDGRRYFRPETLALIDAEPDIEEAPMLMARGRMTPPISTGGPGRLTQPMAIFAATQRLARSPCMCAVHHGGAQAALLFWRALWDQGTQVKGGYATPVATVSRPVPSAFITSTR